MAIQMTDIGEGSGDRNESDSMRSSTDDSQEGEGWMGGGRCK